MIIDHSKFVSYTLNFNGCNFITSNYDSAVKQLQILNTERFMATRPTEPEQ